MISLLRKNTNAKGSILVIVVIVVIVVMNQIDISSFSATCNMPLAHCLLSSATC